MAWWRITSSQGIHPLEGQRLHVRVDGRFITVFRNKNKLSAIDSVCHHAAGPLTTGSLQEIEDLGATVVLCPWHNFMVNIESGDKIYQSVDIINNVPKQSGWKVGAVVQRPFQVVENTTGVYLRVPTTEGYVASDKDAGNERCGRYFTLHSEVPVRMNEDTMLRLFPSLAVLDVGKDPMTTVNETELN